MDRSDPAPVRRLGRYALIDRLAVGGMAEVYVACDVGSADRLVVVKRILPHLAQNPEFVDSFAREAKLAAKIRDRNVVRIVEFGEADNVPFIVMEYVDGVTLKELLATAGHGRPGPLPVAVALALLVQACAGAHAAHELLDDAGRPYGLVHRDITPHNLMVDEAGQVKLLDFGIAKACEGMDQTRTGALKGKIAYMAPEQCRQERLDRRADVFSLGVVGYQLLAGEKPFQGASELAIMQAIILGKCRPLSELRPDVPQAVAEVISRALGVEASSRPETASAFGDELAESATQSGIDMHAAAVETWLRRALAAPLRTKRSAIERARARTLSSISDSTQISPYDHFQIPERGAQGTAVRGLGAVPGVGVGARGSPPGARAGTMPQVRVVPAVAILAALVILGGSIQWVGETGPSLEALAATMPGAQEPLDFVLAPKGDAAVLLHEVEPVRLFLERQLGRPVELVFARSYREAAVTLVEGDADFGILPAGTVALARELDPTLEIVAVEEVDHTSSSDAYLLVRRDGPIRTVADVEGKVVCWADPLSNSGYVIPRAYLAARNIDPERLPAQMSRTHDQVLRDLVAGACDVGATHSGNYLSSDQRGIPSTRLQILATTGSAPHDAVVAGSKIAPEVVAEVRRLLQTFDPTLDDLPEAATEAHAITGFVPPPPGYPALAEVASKEAKSEK